MKYKVWKYENIKKLEIDVRSTAADPFEGQVETCCFPEKCKNWEIWKWERLNSLKMKMRKSEQFEFSKNMKNEKIKKCGNKYEQ